MSLQKNKKDKIREEYDRTADSYDEEWSYYVKQTTIETLERLELSEGERLLDVGCGTGYLLRQLHSVGFSGESVGIDLSPEMLNVAESKSSDSTNYLASNSEKLPFHDNTFSSVVTCNAFHFFLNPQSFIEEVHRVLEPEGYLYITDWNDNYWACWCCDLYLSWTDPAHTKVYGPDEMEALLNSSDFRIRSFDSYKIDWLWGLMTIKAQK